MSESQISLLYPRLGPGASFIDFTLLFSPLFSTLTVGSGFENSRKSSPAGI